MLANQVIQPGLAHESPRTIGADAAREIIDMIAVLRGDNDTILKDPRDFAHPINELADALVKVLSAREIDFAKAAKAVRRLQLKSDEGMLGQRPLANLFAMEEELKLRLGQFIGGRGSEAQPLVAALDSVFKRLHAR